MRLGLGCTVYRVGLSHSHASRLTYPCALALALSLAANVRELLPRERCNQYVFTAHLCRARGHTTSGKGDGW